MHVSVQDGTNAGWKRLLPKTAPWFCQHCETESRYRVCIHCGGEKP